MITPADARFPAACLCTGMGSAEGVLVGCLVLAAFVPAAMQNAIE